jgi:hypothetical protein
MKAYLEECKPGPWGKKMPLDTTIVSPRMTVAVPLQPKARLEIKKVVIEDFDIKELTELHALVAEWKSRRDAAERAKQYRGTGGAITFDPNTGPIDWSRVQITTTNDSHAEWLDGLYTKKANND